MPEQLDAVWQINGAHGVHSKLFGVPDKIPAVDKQIFASLKPGGVLTVADFAAEPGSGSRDIETLHRSDADAVKAKFLAAGFVLDAQSNLLRNAADDYTKPSNDPSVQGHVDDYLFRFKKPDAAPTVTLRPPKGSKDGYYGNTQIVNRGMEEERPRRERHMLYHADGSYQEFGIDDMQSGLWYWDAAGHNCMLHQFSADQRGFVVCHTVQIGKKPRDHWDNVQAVAGGTEPNTMVSGYDPMIP